MRDYFKGITKFPVRLIPLVVCATILAAAVSIYITISEKTETDRKVEILQREATDLEWMFLEDLINDSYLQSKRDAKILALETEYSLRTNYPDLDILKEQFVTESYSVEFNQILRDVLYNDEVKESFLTLVGTEDNLITMFSNDENHMLKGLDSETVVSWSDVENMTPNPILTKKAIDSIMSKNNEVIFVQSTESDSAGLKNINDVNIDSLEKLFRTEGISALSNISLLSAAYITETGDIFGVDDTTLLKVNDTHKIVIVKAVNLRDVIRENKYTINHMVGTINDLTELTELQGEKKVLQGVLWSFILFLISLLMVAVYNSEEKKGHLREEDSNEGGNDKTMRGE